uniref:Uncharacterized protein n=1 Tax=Arundo donax TaxID=35708 RepID=A0A0A8ZUW3_ARUDO
MLACFLQHSPILEKFTLQVSKVPKVPVQTERSFEPLEQSFACGHLKIVEIKCSEVDRRIHKTFGILSTHGIPLEQVNIQQAIKLLDLDVPSNLPIEGKDPGLWIYLLSP